MRTKERAFMMEEVLQFLAENPIFYLATVEGDQPRVRPFGFVMEADGKLCFSTSNQKPVFQQMTQNPKVELCTCSKDGRWVRVCGTIRVVPGDAIRQKALDTMPALKGMYSIGDGIFEIFALDNACATFYSMAEAPRTIEL